MSLKKQKNFLAVAILSAGLFLAAVPLISQAGGLVPCGGAAEKPCTVLDIFTLVAKVTNWLIWAAAIYAVWKILEHGFGLIYTLGSEESITKHKEGITDAVVGFVLVMMAYIIINTVVNFILLGYSPAGAKINLQSPCTYLNASASCVNGQ